MSTDGKRPVIEIEYEETYTALGEALCVGAEAPACVDILDVRQIGDQLRWTYVVKWPADA